MTQRGRNQQASGAHTSRSGKSDFQQALSPARSPSPRQEGRSQGEASSSSAIDAAAGEKKS